MYNETNPVLQIFHVFSKIGEKLNLQDKLEKLNFTELFLNLQFISGAPTPG